MIDELPAQRLPIKNCVVDTSYRPKAYSFMEKQIRQGRQVYVICPMVEESEGMDGENVLDYTMKLRNVFPPDIKVASLHGKMKAKEKNAVMEAFAAGECGAFWTGTASPASWACRAWRISVLLYFYAGKWGEGDFETSGNSE